MNSIIQISKNHILIKKFCLKYIKKYKPERCLILDIYNEYESIDISTDYNANGIYRIVFKGLSVKDSQELYLNSIDKYKNGLLICGNPNIFFGKSLPKQIIFKIATGRHYNLSSIINFSSVEQMFDFFEYNWYDPSADFTTNYVNYHIKPKKNRLSKNLQLIDNSDFLILYKTNEPISRHKNNMPSYIYFLLIKAKKILNKELNVNAVKIDLNNNKLLNLKYDSCNIRKPLCRRYRKKCKICKSLCTRQHFKRRNFNCKSFALYTGWHIKRQYP